MAVIGKILNPSKGKIVANPFLKWAGGKAGLLSQYELLFPDSFEGYYEPFLGGGALFFHLRPIRAVLSDVNLELLNVYSVVRESPNSLLQCLSVHLNEREYYYQVRGLDLDRLSPVERAARFIYLNKTCYNGLYRVNRQGQFNVPFGRYTNPKICDSTNLLAASQALAAATIETGDFETVLSGAGRRDLVYLDPPYHPLSVTSGFTGYARHGFGELEQIRLATVFRKLDGVGCQVMLSNSDTPLIRQLYDGYDVREVAARRAINSRGDRRGAISELVIRNYD